MGPLEHTNTVFRLAFDPTGRWLVTGTIIQRPPDIYVMKYPFRPGDCLVGQARVWDAISGQPLTDPIDLDDPAFGVEFSPDGSAVMVFGIGRPSGSRTDEVNSVTVIDLPSGRPRFAPLPHKNTLGGAGWSPDGRFLATCTGDNRVTVWNAHTGDPVHRALKYDGNSAMWPQTVRFSPDGTWVAVVGMGEVHVWDVRSGATVAVIKCVGAGRDFAFSSAGDRLMVLSRTGALDVWTLSGLGPAQPPFSHEDDEVLTSVGFSPDGKSVCTVGFSGHPRIWDVASSRPRGPTLIPSDESGDRYGYERSRASWSPDGTLLVVRNGDSTARVWDALHGVEKPFCLRHEADVLFAEFSPDGKQIATTSSDHTARLWDAATGAPLVPPLQHSNRVTVAHFSGDGRRLVTGTWAGGTVHVWDAVTGMPISPPLLEGTNPTDGKPLEVLDVCISPDGTRVAMGGHSFSATLRDAVTGRLIGVPMPHRHSIWTLKFSLDGRRLLTTSMDQTARIWDAFTGVPMTPPFPHDGPVTSGDFSPDGLRVITGSEDGSARVWDATTGEPLGPKLRHEKWITHVSFSPDGRVAATASADGTARLWEMAALDWANDELVAARRLFLGARLGDSEQIEPLEPSEAEEAWRRAGSRLGATASPESATRWHRRQLSTSERKEDWFAAEFHARWLTELLRDDAAAQSDLERILARRPPRRDPATPPE